MPDSLFTEFKFEVAGVKHLAAGECLTEGIANVDYALKIECCPRGHKEGNGENVSLCLYLSSTPKVVDYVVFEAFVMGSHGLLHSSRVKRSMAVQVSGERNSSAVWHSFLRRSDIESLYGTDGVVRLVCGVIVMRSTQAEAEADTDVVTRVRPSDIGDDLGRLLDCGDGSDVSFSVGGRTFPAHRVVLAARSPVFKAQLLGPMSEARMPSVTLDDIEPAAFEILLRFVYTDALPPRNDEMPELLQHVLAAADRYALDRLKLLCAEKLYDTVSADTVADMIALAETHTCPRLKNRCIDFLMEEGNFMKAAMTDGYFRLMLGFPSVIQQMRELAKRKKAD